MWQSAEYRWQICALFFITFHLKDEQKIWEKKGKLEINEKAAKGASKNYGKKTNADVLMDVTNSE